MPARFRSLIHVSLQRLNFSLVASTMLAAILVGVAFWFVALQQTEHERVRRTLEVRNQVTQVLALPRALSELERLVADNPTQQDAVRRLRQLTADKLLEVRTTVELRRAGSADKAL